MALALPATAGIAVGINPAHPRPTDAALLLHTCLARLPSLRLPNFPGFP